MARKLGNKQYSMKFKQEVVTFLINCNSYPTTRNKFGVSYYSLRKWLREDNRKEAQKMARKQGKANYAQEFKIEVVFHSFESELTLGEVAKYWSIDITSLHRWRKQFKEDIKLLHSKRGMHKNHDRKFDIYDFDLKELSLYERKILGALIADRCNDWTRIERYQYIKLVGHSKMFLYQYTGITRQAYSKWLVKENPYNGYNKELANTVLDIHNNKPEMGHRVIADMLRQKWNKTEGIVVTDYKVLKVMQQLGIKGASNGKVKGESNKRQVNYDDRDLIRRQFRAKVKYTKWYMDFTYLKLNGQMYYVLFIVDGYDKEIMHLKMYKRKTGQVVANALSRLIKDRNIDGSKLIIHTDQGNEFTNQVVRRLCERNEIRQSFSRAGTPLDNALIESIIGNYKRTFKARYLKKKVSRVFISRKNTDWNLEYNTEIPQRILGSVPPLHYMQ